jgi:transcriptional regulator with XRE-family HTH domain
MDQATDHPAFGALLRRWRLHRGISQLALSLDADVSARHLSWLESGKAQPSRAMVLRLADRLDLPLRERNLMLLAAGLAPMFSERPLADPALAVARHALQRLLDAHEPWPAMAVDRHWQLVAHNRLVPLLMASAAAHLQVPPVNVLRLSLHPQGLAPMVVNLAAWREHVFLRLQRQLAATADPVLRSLLDELRALPLPDAPALAEPHETAAALPLDVAVPLTLRGPLGTLNFITTITLFGAPHDVTVSELAVETLLPADEATASALRQLHATLDRPTLNPP